MDLLFDPYVGGVGPLPRVLSSQEVQEVWSLDEQDLFVPTGHPTERYVTDFSDSRLKGPTPDDKT